MKNYVIYIFTRSPKSLFDLIFAFSFESTRKEDTGRLPLSRFNLTMKEKVIAVFEMRYPLQILIQ